MQDEHEELEEISEAEADKLAEELGLGEEDDNEEDGFEYLALAQAGLFQAQNTLISQLIEGQKLIIFELRKLNNNFASAKINTSSRG
jgi:hypothetical protein